MSESSMKMRIGLSCEGMDLIYSDTMVARSDQEIMLTLEYEETFLRYQIQHIKDELRAGERIEIKMNPDTQIGQISLINYYFHRTNGGTVLPLYIATVGSGEEKSDYYFHISVTLLIPRLQQHNSKGPQTNFSLWLYSVSILKKRNDS